MSAPDNRETARERWVFRPPGLLALALLLALLFRLPFVPYAVVDWDESTFALVGDSVVRGHLPYTELVENKPPLIFLLFALIQLAFGKSIVAIRLGGVLLVALTAWLCALTARRAFGLRAWAALALLPIVALSTFGPGSGALMAEHLAMLLIAGVLLLLTAPRYRPATGFLLSLCAAAAVLTRTNLAYPALLLGLAAPFLPLAPGVRRLPFLAAFATGALLPLAVLLFAYRHDLGTLYGAAVVGPLAYAHGAPLLSPAWFREAAGLLGDCARHAMWPLLVGFAAGSALRLARPVAGSGERRMVAVLLLGWLATFVGVAAIGHVFGHYLMQLLPFAAPLFACAGAGLYRPGRPLAGLAALLALLWWGEPLARKYLHHARRLADGEPLWADPATRLVDYLDRAGMRGQPLFLADAHIAYWLLDSRVPTRIAHPSNLGRADLTRAVAGEHWSASAELDAIFAQHPQFVVLPDDMRLLSLDRAARHSLDAHLASGYQPVEAIGHLHLYRLREPPGASTKTSETAAPVTPP